MSSHALRTNLPNLLCKRIPTLVEGVFARSLCETLPVLDADPEMSRNDALAQPSRVRLFGLLAELKRAAKTAELAGRLDMHPNGVRLHLARLEGAGLVARVRLQGPRGRPADAWIVAPGAHPGGQAPRAYRDLGRWLARSIRERPISLRSLERTGREIGRELAPSQSDPGLDAVEQALAALGFAPFERSRQGDRRTVRLGNCPYRDVVRENQPAICTLHKGITRGLLDVLAPGATLERFVPHDPAQAGCVLELRSAAAAS
jgi:predicted ArsR family transcriptional regulator